MIWTERLEEIKERRKNVIILISHIKNIIKAEKEKLLNNNVNT